MWAQVLVTFELVLLKRGEGRRASSFARTMVVNQPSLKENHFLRHSNLLGCCSWLKLKFYKMNVACSLFSSNQLHVWDGFSPRALEQGFNGNVRWTDLASKAGVWMGFTLRLQVLIQKLAVLT